MNFEEWYKQYSGFKSVNSNSIPADVIDAWDACKKEVLKIFEKHKVTNGMTLNDIYKEIKNL